MNPNSIIRRIPYWAYLLVLLVLLVLISYVIAYFQIPVDGAGSRVDQGKCIVTRVKAGSPAENAGLQAGDVIQHIGTIPVFGEEHFHAPESLQSKTSDPKVVPVYRHGHFEALESFRAGDSISYVILRDGNEITLNVTLDSFWSQSYWFYLAFYSLILVVSISSIYILYKKPYDPTARIFFIYLQLFAIAQSFTFLYLDKPYAIFASIVFILSFNLFGVALLHFHLIFPKPVPFYKKIKGLIKLVYLFGILLGIALSVLFIRKNSLESDEAISTFYGLARWSISWMALTLFLALTLAIYQFRLAKNTQARKQLRLVLIGSIFGLVTPIFFGIYPEFLWQIEREEYRLTLLQFTNGVGTYIMTSFLAVAIFHYRIWNVEPFIKKVILYGIATFIIFILYVGLLYLVDILLIKETKLIHFVILGFSTWIFLLLKDFIQRGVDRLFHRESYISAKAVADFELHFAGVYQFDQLSSRIGESLDNIFHFKSFVIAVKKDNLQYKTAYQLGSDVKDNGKAFEITDEIDELVAKAKIFSTEELRERPVIFEETNAQLIVPLINGDQTFGFFILGAKLSEKSYAMQDIILLVLLSRRVVSIYNTANLYLKDLNQQLMLQKERTRIAKDIHDDVGANLTRIAIMSEIVKNKVSELPDAKQSLDRITQTCREVRQDLTQIVWALDPKKESLVGLLASIRRFAIEYLDLTKVECIFNLPEEIPEISLCTETRRNIYLSIRESVHNVVKHAGAKKVWISLTIEEDWYTIMIKDDGVGFNTDGVTSPGNGLGNIKKRINNIGGKSLLSSERGIGTEIKLIIPKESKI